MQGQLCRVDISGPALHLQRQFPALGCLSGFPHEFGPVAPDVADLGIGFIDLHLFRLIRPGTIRLARTGHSGIARGWLAKPSSLRRMGLFFQDYFEAVWAAQDRRATLIARIALMIGTWSLGPLVQALRGLRGLDLLSAATFIATTEDLSRFESPRRLRGYLGLVRQSIPAGVASVAEGSPRPATGKPDAC